MVWSWMFGIAGYVGLWLARCSPIITVVVVCCVNAWPERVSAVEREEVLVECNNLRYRLDCGRG